MGKKSALVSYHKKRTAVLSAEVRRLRKELRDAHRVGYERGSADATLTAYLAIQDYGLPGLAWLSARMSAITKKMPPPHSNEIDDRVTAAVIEHMASYDAGRAAKIEREFQKFLAGDSTK